MLSNQNLTVNGKAVDCEKYNIDGNNYFMLRDLALLLNGTTSQFSVGYDKASRTVSITTGEAYTPDGSELKAGVDNSATAVPSNQPIVIDGELRDDLTAYNIGGHNFFKLRELGQALGFYVHYDKATRTMLVDSADEDEDFTTGDAGLDNPRNQDGIGAIEAAMEKAFPELSVRRGFTAQIIIDHVYKRDDEVIDNVTQALERAIANGVKEL